MEVAHRLGMLKPLPLRGPGRQAPPREPLDLQPGELVQVRSPEEIAATLDETGHNRGCRSTARCCPYCGQTLRRQGPRQPASSTTRPAACCKILEDAIILEGAVCSGECSTGRWFCPREIYPYWREAWVQRVETPIDRLERAQSRRRRTAPATTSSTPKRGGAGDGAVVARQHRPRRPAPAPQRSRTARQPPPARSSSAL